MKQTKTPKKNWLTLGVRTCKTLTSNVKQRKQRRQNSRTEKKTTTKGARQRNLGDLVILGGQSVGKDLDSGINPRILPQGDEAAAYKHTWDMSFLGLLRCM